MGCTMTTGFLKTPPRRQHLRASCHDVRGGGLKARNGLTAIAGVNRNRACAESGSGFGFIQLASTTA